MERDPLIKKMPEGTIRDASRYLVGVGLLLSVVVVSIWHKTVKGERADGF
jgi:hypothetical protein